MRPDLFCFRGVWVGLGRSGLPFGFVRGALEALWIAPCAFTGEKLGAFGGVDALGDEVVEDAELMLAVRLRRLPP